MIDLEMRKAIWRLYQEGMSLREMSRRLGPDRKTVKRIIDEQGQGAAIRSRADKIEVDPELIRGLFRECGGWAERIHEKLRERGTPIAYSTLTERIRELGLRDPREGEERSGQVPDKAGEEFQHDTSPYTIKIGGRPTRVQASLLYWRFSKVRYLKFYRFFTRFQMKCFFHEALIHYQYSCGKCIIDNTNLAVLRGTGENAVFVPEMIAFAAHYGFTWMAHRLRHSNRKAGGERGFWTLETNFLPGRTFSSMEDLNRQAMEWVEKKRTTPNKKTKIIPQEAFEWEKGEMRRVPEGLPAPYQIHERGIDQYGFISFQGNFFWIPRGTRGKVKVLEYAGEIHIYQDRKILARYRLPDDSVKGRKWAPEGVDHTFRPKKKTLSLEEEEKRLRLLGPEVSAFMEKALKEPRSSQGKCRWIREFLALSQRITLPLFLKTLERAEKYRVYDVKILEKVAVLILKRDQLPDLKLDWEISSGVEEREAFREGEWSEAPNLELFDLKYRREDNERETHAGPEGAPDGASPGERPDLPGGGKQKEPLP